MRAHVTQSDKRYSGLFNSDNVGSIQPVPTGSIGKVSRTSINMKANAANIRTRINSDVVKQLAKAKPAEAEGRLTFYYEVLNTVRDNFSSSWFNGATQSDKEKYFDRVLVLALVRAATAALNRQANSEENFNHTLADVRCDADFYASSGLISTNSYSRTILAALDELSFMKNKSNRAATLCDCAYSGEHPDPADRAPAPEAQRVDVKTATQQYTADYRHRTPSKT